MLGVFRRCCRLRRKSHSARRHRGRLGHVRSRARRLDRGRQRLRRPTLPRCAATESRPGMRRLHAELHRRSSCYPFDIPPKKQCRARSTGRSARRLARADREAHATTAQAARPASCASSRATNTSCAADVRPRAAPRTAVLTATCASRSTSPVSRHVCEVRAIAVVVLRRVCGCGLRRAQPVAAVSRRLGLREHRSLRDVRVRVRSEDPRSFVHASREDELRRRRPVHRRTPATSRRARARTCTSRSTSTATAHRWPVAARRPRLVRRRLRRHRSARIPRQRRGLRRRRQRLRRDRRQRRDVRPASRQRSSSSRSPASTGPSPIRFVAARRRAR